MRHVAGYNQYGLGQPTRTLARQRFADVGQGILRFSELMELVLRYCNRPEPAGRVPQYLAWMAGNAAAKVATAPDVPRPATQAEESEFTKKLSIDLVDFVGRATGLPDVLMKELRRPPTSEATTAAASVVAKMADAMGIHLPVAHVAPARVENEKQPDLLSSTTDGDVKSAGEESE